MVSNSTLYILQKDTVVWQAVVRIRSTQSITKYDAKGKPQPGTGEKKETIEYVVIQKHWTAGKETPWVVWGTTEETTREFFPLGVWRRWGEWGRR